MIVGTSGHIDHGKTALVKALTGTDTDRLKEEKKRGITIDLGFAYVPLPNGQILGFVDVPGHERFVQTMLAGAASVDYVMLVVAADDGVMPQTLEHLQIVNFLNIAAGIVVITKIDLVDQLRLASVEADIRAAICGSTLASVDIRHVSTLTGEGIQALKLHLWDQATRTPQQPVRRTFRMAVDRCFTIVGSGTVVTGVVVGGAIEVDGRVRVLPSGLEARVRSIHALSCASNRASVGQRCALNLAGAGVSKVAIQRGDWLVDPVRSDTTRRIDAELRLVRAARLELKSWSPVYFHLGTSALPARVVPLSTERLTPGEQGEVQVVLPVPLPLRHGDRFVLRDIGATRTIGGGTVLDPSAPARKRRTPERMAQLQALREASAEKALQRLSAIPPGIIFLSSFARDRGLTAEESGEIITRSGLISFGFSETQILTDKANWIKLKAEVEATLNTFHMVYPHLQGMHIDRLRTTLGYKLPKPMFTIVLDAIAAEGGIYLLGSTVRLQGHTLQLSVSDTRIWVKVRPLLASNPVRPPTVHEIAEHVGHPVAAVRQLLKALARMAVLAEVATDRFFLRSAVFEIGIKAAELAQASTANSFTVNEFRNVVGCGRNVAIQILEFFDRKGLTARSGERRQVTKDPAQLFAGTE
jgi:selenocysteine-specific elongation factor